MNSQDRILLTGAGFTKNFGAPLAKELWAIIFNNPILDEAPQIRRVLRRDFDIESVYDNVLCSRDEIANSAMNSLAWAKQQQALKTAVVEAYEHIDAKVRAFSTRRDAPYPVNIYGVQEFVSKFAGGSGNPGFFFTLNQDLFVERKYYNGQQPRLPGVPNRPSWFTTNGTLSLADERCVIPDMRSKFDFSDWPFYYVKLHGSSNWYTADQTTMVIGRAKEAQILGQPILTSYFEAFKSVIAHRGRRLLCVGYSFSDEHINSAISDGVRAGLKLYVLSPEPPDSLAARLGQKRQENEVLWDGLEGYFQTDLRTLFPADQSITEEWRLVQKRFFSA